MPGQKLHIFWRSVTTPFQDTKFSLATLQPQKFVHRPHCFHQSHKIKNYGNGVHSNAVGIKIALSVRPNPVHASSPFHTWGQEQISFQKH